MKKYAKIITASLAAAAMLMGSMPVFANEGTTTQKTVYKNLDANTEIYRVTDAPGSDYPDFHAKAEPKGGIYYGRIARGGQTGNGYGLANLGDMSNESMVSFYYDLGDGYSLQYWSYLYGKALTDGSRALLINLNFNGEASDCAAVAKGSYDGKLAEAFSYLNTLSCPVFVRIGAEMNVWENRVSPESYQAAYRHIAEIARRQAPNAALVFSPNFSGASGVDMDSFYPGDGYVDWIGTSLYYNQYANNGDTKNDAFYGVGKYGDPMLNIQQTVNLSRLHKKPVMVTEGGSAYVQNGKDSAAFAAERVQKAYSFLPMVYPEIKAMVYSDSNFGSTGTCYQLSGSQAVSAAYQKAVQANPVLRRSVSQAASYYTKASASPSGWSGMVTLAAYTYAAEKPSAVWYVDGKAMATVQEYPYTYQLDADALAPGAHTLEVKFSNGAKKACTIQTGTAKP